MTRSILLSGKQCQLEITQPMGAGGGWHVFVDGYYQGAIVLNNGVWKLQLNDRAALTMEWEGVVMEMVGG